MIWLLKIYLCRSHWPEQLKVPFQGDRAIMQTTLQPVGDPQASGGHYQLHTILGDSVPIFLRPEPTYKWRATRTKFHRLSTPAFERCPSRASAQPRRAVQRAERLPLRSWGWICWGQQKGGDGKRNLDVWLRPRLVVKGIEGQLQYATTHHPASQTCKGKRTECTHITSVNVCQPMWTTITTISAQQCAKQRDIRLSYNCLSDPASLSIRTVTTIHSVGLPFVTTRAAHRQKWPRPQCLISDLRACGRVAWGMMHHDVNPN